MPPGEERRRAVCGRTACTDRCGGERKPGQSGSHSRAAQAPLADPTLSRTESLEENARPLPGGESPAQERGAARMPRAASAQGQSVALLRSAVRLRRTPAHRPPRRSQARAARWRSVRSRGRGRRTPDLPDPGFRPWRASRTLPPAGTATSWGRAGAGRGRGRRDAAGWRSSSRKPRCRASSTRRGSACSPSAGSRAPGVPPALRSRGRAVVCLVCREGAAVADARTADASGAACPGRPASRRVALEGETAPPRPGPPGRSCGVGVAGSSVGRAA